MVAKSERTNKKRRAEPFLLILLFCAMKKILLPSFADQKKKVSENDNAENPDKEEVISKKIDVIWSLHWWCLSLRRILRKVAAKI